MIFSSLFHTLFHTYIVLPKNVLTCFMDLDRLRICDVNMT